MKIKSIIIILDILLMYALAMILGYTVLWLVAIFTSVLFVLSLVMIITAVFSLKFTQYVSYPVISKGSNTDIVLEYNNRFIFIYPNVKLKYHDNNVDEITIFPGKHTHSSSFKPRLKGVYDVGFERIIINDFFNIFSFSFKIKTKEKIYVLPVAKEYKISEAEETTEVISKEIKVKKTRDKNTISDLREYKYGDTINKINWKATAKFNSVIVNNYENRYCSKTFLYVGSFSSEDDYMSLIYDDFACEIAITLVKNIIINENKEISLFYKGKDVIIDTETTKELNQFGMYLAEQAGESVYEEDMKEIEKRILKSANYNKIVFIIKEASRDMFELQKIARANNIEMDIYRIEKLDQKRLGISKVNTAEGREGVI